ncbi:MAG: ATP-binding protein [Deltaproteobacteria bacterium]|nr:ATP-binding protein [Deltaproteobacteria bacterium]
MATNKAFEYDIDNALDALVEQFSDSLAFFRELIQNAIDAGSSEIEIRTEYNDGVMTIHVDDFGEGMTRKIIDTRLTRLFASGKDGDYTKIGRFGIGFVSVFAIEPDLVCLDTSRAGENWRVVFERDRSFTCIERDYPVEGTKIRIIKQVAPDAYAEFKRRAFEVISFWCKHAAAEITVDGQRVNQSFDLDTQCTVVHREEGTRITLGLMHDGSNFSGYYNRGLTLWEGTEETIMPGIGFKIDSRYLEHTLTRDTILRDDNYEKAMKLTRRLVAKDLTATVFSQLRARASEPEAADTAVTKEREADALYSLAAPMFELAKSGELASRQRAVPIFRGLDSPPISIDEANAAAAMGWLCWDAETSPISKQMLQEGWRVIQCERDGPVYQTVSSLVGRLPRASGSYCIAVKATEKQHPGAADLVGALKNILSGAGAKIKAIEIASLRYRHSKVAKRVAIIQQRFGEITAIKEAAAIGMSLFSQSRVLVLNSASETTQDLMRLAVREPALAGLLAAKLLFLRDELGEELDASLAHEAWRERCRRSRT